MEMAARITGNKVTLDTEKSEEFTVKKGLQQGDPLFIIPLNVVQDRYGKAA